MNLRWLDISHNHISELGNYFDLTGELHLTELDVSFNSLKQLGPHNIPDSIENLMVNDNKISQIVPYTFFKKTHLTKVDLTVNDLKTIDRNSLRLSSDVTRFPDFYLTGNPIECDCRGRDFFKISILKILIFELSAVSGDSVLRNARTPQRKTAKSFDETNGH